MKKREKGHPAVREAKGFNRLSGAVHGGLSRAMSSVRLSLSFRIAMHYALELVLTTLGCCVALTLCLLAAQVPYVQDTVERIALLTPAEDGAYAPAQVLDGNVTALLSPEALPEGGALIGAEFGTMFTPALLSTTPSFTVLMPHLGQTLRVTFTLPYMFRSWLLLMGGLLFCDLCRILRFLRRRNRLDKSVLRPIRDITDMAATLSASNLSDRINIAGTKNELKDLAVVINTMLDRIERSYNSQKQFVSDASHELRTPIAVIQGYVDMLARWGKDDKQVLDEGITAISQETRSMKDLVESLLFLARHDKKTLMMEMEPFDPCEVVTAVHREAAMVSPNYHFVLEPLEHCTIEADKGMVKQVMRILCDNAVKYTPEGGTITMGVEKWTGGCTLLMRDNGSGISQEDLPKIFDRFYRSDSARKSEGGGHGLGLSIARIIVVAHGGKIRVRSKLGAGTTFAITLPAVQTKSGAVSASVA